MLKGLREDDPNAVLCYFLLLILNNINMKWVCYVLLCYLCVLECFAMSLSEIEDFTNYLKESSNLDQHVKSYQPEDGHEEDENISDYAWETSGKFEGDLILNERQRKMIVSNVVEGLARNGLTDTTKRWPNNELVYFINAQHFSSAQLQSIQDGIDTLAGASCVKFRPYQKGDRDAVVIQGSSRGCFSQVGYQGGYQILNLDRRHPAGRGCFREGTVIHEHLHALGFYHMQSSPDRDEFVDVLWDNIIKRARHNFRKYNTYAVSDFGVGYDYMSVLHYSRKAFSSNGQDTLVTKNGADIGQRTGLSEKDIIKLNKMYCDADSGLFTEDGDASNDVEKKRKGTKNKPFVGHGLGYQKGKTVVIKLPKDDDKSRDLSKTDYFSKTTQGVPSEIFKETEAREEIALYNYQFPKTNLNEYDMKSLIKKYPKELKMIETNNHNKRVPQMTTTGLYENNYRNINIPNEDLRKDRNNKEIIGLSPVIFREEIGNDDNIESVYQYGGHLSRIPTSATQNKNHIQLTVSEPNKHLDYNPVTQYDSIMLYQPNKSSEKEKDFLFTNLKYDSPPTISYESLGDFTGSKWHSNKKYKPDLYIQERLTQHELFELPEIRYSY